MLKNISKLEGIYIDCLSLCLSASHIVMFTDQLSSSSSFSSILIIYHHNHYYPTTTLSYTSYHYRHHYNYDNSHHHRHHYYPYFPIYLFIFLLHYHYHYTSLSFFIDGAPGTYSSTTGGYGKVKKNKNQHTWIMKTYRCDDYLFVFRMTIIDDKYNNDVSCSFFNARVLFELNSCWCLCNII